MSTVFEKLPTRAKNYWFIAIFCIMVVKMLGIQAFAKISVSRSLPCYLTMIIFEAHYIEVIKLLCVAPGSLSAFREKKCLIVSKNCGETCFCFSCIVLIVDGVILLQQTANKGCFRLLIEPHIILCGGYYKRFSISKLIKHTFFVLTLHPKFEQAVAKLSPLYCVSLLQAT